MKTLRFLLAVLFLFSTGSGIVSASPPGVSYAFIPLISEGIDPAIPIEVSARHSFNRLVPLLTAAQRRGDIIVFEPELSFGFLKVQYRSGFDIAALVDRPVYDNIHSAVAATSPQVLSQINDLPPAPTPLFHLRLYNSCFWATGLGANRRVSTSMRTGSGRLVANYEGNADASGNLLDCFSWIGNWVNVMPTYRITFKRYNGNTLLGTYSVTAQWIKFNSVNKLTSEVRGKAPAGKSFEATWEHPNLNLANNYLVVTKTGTVPGSGNWSVDFGTVSIRGGDEIEFWDKQTANFEVGRRFIVPYSECELGGNNCTLYGYPGQAATLSIIHAGHTYTFNGVFDDRGEFFAELLSSSLNPIFLAAGDKVSGTGISPYNLPNLTAVLHAATDTVTGKAPPNKNFLVMLNVLQTSLDYRDWVHSDASGNYTADFSGSVDIKPAQSYAMGVFYVNPTTGNDTGYIKLISP